MRKIENYDPRAIFYLVAISSAVAVFSQGLLLCAVNFLAILFCAVWLRVDIRSLVFKLRALWGIVLFSAVMQSVFNPSGEVLLELFGYPIVTLGGIEKAFVIIFRMASVICGAGLLLKLGQPRIIAGLIALRVPYEIAYMIILGLRFLPSLQEQLRDGITAIQLRGLDIQSLLLRRRIGVYTDLLFPAVSANVVRARKIAVSMHLRGFRAFEKQTTMQTLKLSGLDWLVMAAATALFLGAVL